MNSLDGVEQIKFYRASGFLSNLYKLETPMEFEGKEFSTSEKSKTDSFWGLGKKGTGKNKLGKLLKQVREELRRIDQAIAIEHLASIQTKFNTNHRKEEIQEK